MPSLPRRHCFWLKMKILCHQSPPCILMSWRSECSHLIHPSTSSTWGLYLALHVCISWKVFLVYATASAAELSLAIGCWLVDLVDPTWVFSSLNKLNADSSYWLTLTPCWATFATWIAMLLIQYTLCFIKKHPLRFFVVSQPNVAQW